jgi:hypothetical protein
MSLQVGSFCYASPGDAGRAACSQFQSSTTISGDSLKTVTCSGADETTGALLLDVVTTSASSGTSTTTQISQSISFPECVNQDYVEFLGVVFAGVLSVYILWLCGWRLLSFIGWTRGDNV